MTLKNIGKISALAGGVIFFIIQFIQPDRSNPVSPENTGTQNDLRAPAHITSLFETACKDCHSNRTTWPLYSYVAPVSWIVSHDVMTARRKFNMSEWGTYTTNKKIRILSGISELVSNREMPLPKYTILHPSADLILSERDSLARWAENEAEYLMDSQVE